MVLGIYGLGVAQVPPSNIPHPGQSLVIHHRLTSVPYGCDTEASLTAVMSAVYLTSVPA